MSDKDISVICRDCGDLVGGVEAGSRVMWTICGCVNKPPRARDDLFRKQARWLLSLFRPKAND